MSIVVLLICSYIDGQKEKQENKTPIATYSTVERYHACPISACF